MDDMPGKFCLLIVHLRKTAGTWPGECESDGRMGRGTLLFARNKIITLISANREF